MHYAATPPPIKQERNGRRRSSLSAKSDLARRFLQLDVRKARSKTSKHLIEEILVKESPFSEGFQSE